MDLLEQKEQVRSQTGTSSRKPKMEDAEQSDEWKRKRDKKMSAKVVKGVRKTSSIRSDVSEPSETVRSGSYEKTQSHSGLSCDMLLAHDEQFSN